LHGKTVGDFIFSTWVSDLQWQRARPEFFIVLVGHRRKTGRQAR